MRMATPGEGIERRAHYLAHAGVDHQQQHARRGPHLDQRLGARGVRTRCLPAAGGGRRVAGGAPLRRGFPALLAMGLGVRLAGRRQGDDGCRSRTPARQPVRAAGGATMPQAAIPVRNRLATDDHRNRTSNLAVNHRSPRDQHGDARIGRQRAHPRRPDLAVLPRSRSERPLCKQIKHIRHPDAHAANARAAAALGRVCGDAADSTDAPAAERTWSGHAGNIARTRRSLNASSNAAAASEDP